MNPLYDLPYHKEHDAQAIKEFIERHPFAFLIGCDAGSRPVATQVPVFIDERGGRTVLSGHVMKGTDHHRAFFRNENVLVVFAGSHAYVSATWYSDPNIPSTWNYMSVHARGTIKFLDDAGLEAVLQKTSLHFEGYDERSPTVFGNLPVEMRTKLSRMIVAFEIEVTDIDTVFKLSQDRDAESHRNIIERLKERGDNGREIADEMEKRFRDGGAADA